MRGWAQRRFGSVGSTLRPMFEGRLWLDPVVLGVIAFVGAAAVGLLGRMPVAYIHDEFAYLLIGETLASGRLTNPTPLFWEHLETFHVLMVPTYMGKYPPAQGVALAVGFLLGHPILGVWLTSALMVAAVTWMLQAWLPREWAAAGGALVLLQLGLSSYFTQSHGLLAGIRLRLMDTIGNARYGIDLPFHYFSEREWRAVFADLDVEPSVWRSRIDLYPWPASWIFGRGLHFVAVLPAGPDG